MPTILLSFLATDAAGESDGPHSNLLRDVLVEMDARVGRIMDSYAERNALEDTVFILTSDHGMELQDPQRRTSAGRILRVAGVQTDFVSAGLVYLKSLDLNARILEDGQTVEVVVRRLSNEMPVVDTLVRAPDLMTSGRTDERGLTRISIPDGFVGEFSLIADHEGFNQAHDVLSTPTPTQSP